MRLHQALILILVTAALAVAGCSGNSPEPAATATPGPIASPSPGVSASPGATAEPSAVPANTATQAAQLFDFSKINWFEYTVHSASETGPSYLRYEASTTTFNGAPAKAEKITVTAPNDTVIDVQSYYDSANGREIGGHVKFVIGGQSFIDSDTIAGDDQYKSNSIAWTFQQGNWPLHSLGTEKVTINGKTYTCTKYTVGDAGEYGTAWMAPGIPLPVRIDSVSEKGAATWELTGWG
jgi:hypothetical protein